LAGSGPALEVVHEPALQARGFPGRAPKTSRYDQHHAEQNRDHHRQADGGWQLGSAIQGRVGPDRLRAGQIRYRSNPAILHDGFDADLKTRGRGEWAVVGRLLLARTLTPGTFRPGNPVTVCAPVRHHHEARSRRRGVQIFPYFVFASVIRRPLADGCVVGKIGQRRINIVLVV